MALHTVFFPKQKEHSSESSLGLSLLEVALIQAVFPHVSQMHHRDFLLF